MKEQVDFPKIIHNPYGWNHPYEQGPDERTPRDPVAGEAVVLQALSLPQDAFEQMNVLWQIEGDGKIYDQEGVRIEQNEGYSVWRFVMPEFPFGSHVTYHFKGYRNGNMTRSNNSEFDVSGWVKANQLTGTQKKDLELVLYWATERPGLRIQQRIWVDRERRLWLEWMPLMEETSPESNIKLKDLSQAELPVHIGRWLVSFEPAQACLLKISSTDGDFALCQRQAPELLLDGAGRVKQILCRFDSPEDEAFYGFGERFNALNQHGQSLDICVYNQYTNQGVRTYIPMPFFVSSQRYGFYLDTSQRVWFDMAGKQHGGWSFQAPLGSAQQLKACMIAKENLWDIVSEFQGLTGEPVLPPVWAFGPWMSSNDWNSQNIVMEQISLTRQHNIPVTVFVIEAWSDESTFYRWNDSQHPLKHPSEVFKLEDFTFPPEGRWPDPKSMIDELHSAGIRVVLWQIPILKKLLEADRILGPQPQHEADEAYMIEQGYCVHQADGDAYRVPPAWFRGSLVLDFTNPAAVDWWMGKRTYLLEEMGVDGFKTDGGEHVWGTDLKFHNGKTSDEMMNLYPKLYQQAFDGFLRKYRGEDGVLFSRAGFVGAQAHPCHWAGDERSTWDAFQASILAGLSLGISGVPFWGWDIAGFYGDVPDADLYLRATAMAVFCPIMQFHSDFNDRRLPSQDRTPWNIQQRSGNPEVISVYRKFANLRMNLLPYIVSEAHTACRSGLPMMRTLVLEYPHDPACADFPYQYMFGSSILIAPVTAPGGESVRCLPPGRLLD